MQRVPRQKRGNALFSVLIMTVVVVPLGLGMVGMWTSQLSLQGSQDHAEGARKVAESAVRLTVARLLKDPTVGTDLASTFTVSLPNDGQSSGTVSFNPGTATAQGWPLSVNNLAGQTAVTGAGGSVVSAESASLVAVGTCAGVQRKIEVILNVPKFPYVVGSSIDLVSLDGLQIFGIGSSGALSNGFANIPASEIVSGHAVCNAQDSGGQPAVQLAGSGTLIKGDAQAVGSINLSSGASVTGAILPNSTSVALPTVNLAQFDTASSPGLTVLSPGTLPSTLNQPTTLSGFCRCNGGLTINNGLLLQGAVLYSVGDLVINGGVSGSGAIISRAGINIIGGGSLQTDSQAALLANGDIVIQGTSAQRAEFRGLVYTEGALSCSYLNMAGSMVINCANPSKQSTFTQSTLVQCPQNASVSFPVTKIVTTSGSTQIPVSSPQVGSLTAALGFNPPPGTTMSGGAYFDQNQLSSLKDPATGQYVMPTDPATLANLFVYSVVTATTDANGVVQTTVTSGSDPNSTLSSAGVPAGGVSTATAGLGQAVQNLLIPDLAAYLAGLNSPNPPSPPSVTTVTLPAGSQVNQVQGGWTLDWSTFLNLADRIRIVSWRRL